jgi:iron complex transport system ATP-binding protein
VSAELFAARDLLVTRRGRAILDLDEVRIGAGQRWVILGPNGSGKSTLLTIASGRLLPSSGEVSLFGHRFGTVDLRSLRSSVGLASSSLTRQLRTDLTALEVVLGGLDGSLEPWWRVNSDDDRDHARVALERAGVLHLAERTLLGLSDGERQQVLLARALLVDPPLLLVDEPSAGLDLGARERLLTRFDDLSAARPDRGVLLVTHHVEEIPQSMTHVLLLRDGRRLASGAIGEVLTSDTLSTCFDLDVEVVSHNGRYSARAR